MRLQSITAFISTVALLGLLPAFGATIVGSVRLDGSGRPGISVSASGVSDTTDSNGVYSLSVPFGTHTVVPDWGPLVFNPASRTVTLTPQSPIAAAAFDVVAHRVSGTVRSGPAGVANVTVTAVGIATANGSAGNYSTTTDGNGNFTMALPASNSYEVFPVAASIPDLRYVSNLQSDVTGISFDLLHDIRGRVLEGTNAIEDVIVTLLTNGVPIATTNSRIDGSFSFLDRIYGNYAITARAPCYAFSPALLNLTLSTSMTNLLFQAVRFPASGRVTDGTNGLADVTISAGTNSAVTDANGYFTISNLAGVHTFVPSKAGETFTPRHRTHVMSPGTTNVNFQLGTFALSNTVGNCTEEELLQAVSGGGIVRLNCDGVIRLNCPLPITQDTFLDATGRAVTLDGGNFTTVFQVASNAHLKLSGLTIANGSGTNGGGIANVGGTVTALGCTFATNVARSLSRAEAGGGAIRNVEGTLFITNCFFLGNAAYGNSNLYAGVLPQAGPGGPGTGGALYNVRGTSVLHGCTFRGNFARGAGTGFPPVVHGEAGRGGALGSTSGVVKVVLTRFETNRAFGGVGGASEIISGGTGQGGAVYLFGGASEFVASTFADNVAVGGATSRLPNVGYGGGSGAGGALFCFGGTVAIVATTLSGNSSVGGLGYEGPVQFQGSGSGGAIAHAGDCTLNITNSTIAHNRTQAGRATHSAYQGGNARGGGISLGTGTVRLINSTVASNLILPVNNTNMNARLGTNFYNGGATIIAYNSIVAGGWFGNAATGEANMCSDFSCGFPTNNINGVNPQLGPLQDNGGDTWTMALAPGSPAIDAGSDDFCPLTDQRGQPRPAGFACDLGAFEVFQAATILGFTPSFGAEGTNVVILGASLAGATSLFFNGVSASILSNTATRIYAVVPTGAFTGPISVNTPFGTATSTSNFIVDSTSPLLAFLIPRADNLVRGLSQIIGTARDETNGSGIVSVSFLLQRFRDFAYWTGTAWGVPTLLSTTLNGDVWQRTNGLPSGLQLEDGAYTLSAQAQDAVGNTAFLSISVTVDKSGAIEPIRRLPDGRVQLRFAGTPGRTYRIEASTNLETWQTIGAVTIDSSGLLQFQDNDAPNFAHRFYRTAMP